ncbi:hypothetical protein DRQ32_03420 [bacterium]|nr:MAG: hypothetical protein DRQ32_03420 [bacterium]
MAAPKKWGYTREQAFGPEMLVAWTDGDLTEILVKEVEERLLALADERAAVAAWARAAQDSAGFEGKDWMMDVREGLMDQCRRVG